MFTLTLFPAHTVCVHPFFHPFFHTGKVAFKTMVEKQKAAAEKRGPNNSENDPPLTSGDDGDVKVPPRATRSSSFNSEGARGSASEAGDSSRGGGSGSQAGSEISVDLDDVREEDEDEEEDGRGKKKRPRMSAEESYRRRQAMRHGAVPIEGEGRRPDGRRAGYVPCNHVVMLPGHAQWGRAD